MSQAIIVGSGVAGPAVALFLQRAGWNVEVFESHDEPDPNSGLFLNVATNGLAVLEQLGLRSALLTDGHAASRTVMWGSRGQQLGVVPNGPVGDPSRGGVNVRRGWLQEVLRTGAADAGIRVTYGARLVGIEESAAGVRAVFADGRTADGDILVACDGIGSVARAHIDPSAARPRYTGLVGLGGFAELPGLAPTPYEQHMVSGARSFFGYLVRDNGTIHWFANVTAPEPAPGTQDSRAPWLEQLRQLHADDPHPVPQILDATTGELRAYPIYDLANLRRWSAGRVVLAGDAAHATSPSAGQGASLALEDAITLATCLRDLPTYTDAFAAYQRLRQPRVEKVIRYARSIDSHKRAPKSRIGIALRDTVTPIFLRKAATDTRNAWLFDHPVDWDTHVTV